MSKLKVLIADDEAPARNKMKRMLDTFEEVEVIYVAENGVDAYENIMKLKPDVVFLDIEMPGLTGLEVAAKIKGDTEPHIVFATAYNEHAIKAFELDAVDYLLKPFNEERLHSALDKIIRNPKSRHQEEEPDDESEMDASTAEAFRIAFATKIPVPTFDRYKLIDFDDVICIEVEDRSTLLYTADKSYPMNQPLEYFEKKLPPQKFLRVNRSCLIGLKHVKEVIIWFGNRFKIVMDNGREIISSREKSKLLKQVLKF